MIEPMANNLIQFLLDHNKQQSELFVGPDQAYARKRYRAAHPTSIAAIKCMDGRVHLPVATETPFGVIQPFRNIGGKFEVGWPYFGQLLSEWIDRAATKNRLCLILSVYHFSAGDKHRGCAGHSYDTEAAQKCAEGIKQQIEHVYGQKHDAVYPVVVGFETDEDALVIHGEDGQKLNMATLPMMTELELINLVRGLFPRMQAQIVTDFVPLLLGNLRHIQSVRASKRPLEDAKHKEQILAVGRGFDWLHLANKALIVGPYSYDLSKPIAVAGQVLLSNIKEGRVPKEDGIVLFSSALAFEQVGAEPLRAAEKATALAKFSLGVIDEFVPELRQYLNVLVGTTYQETRLFTPIDFKE